MLPPLSAPRVEVASALGSLRQLGSRSCHEPPPVADIVGWPFLPAHPAAREPAPAAAPEPMQQQPRADNWKASGHKGAVAAGGQGAVDAGMTILQSGGNAADAAVATILALSVTDSTSFCFGGEVPIMIYDAKRELVEVICGQGAAPAGHPQALRRHRHPRQGRRAGGGARRSSTPVSRRSIATAPRRSPRWPHRCSPSRSWRSAGMASDLARTIRRLIDAEKGSPHDRRRGLRLVADYFYRGPIAREIDAWSKANGGLMRYATSPRTPRASRIRSPSTTAATPSTSAACGRRVPYLLQTLRLLEPSTSKAWATTSRIPIHTTSRR